MVGKIIGPYRVLEKIGEGGMGEVYRAHDSRLNRDVAIKVLPEAFAQDAERLLRLTREARTLATLNHPNIAQIHGLEQDGDIPALVMELVDGEDLSAEIARGPVPLAEALVIARQVADALDAAHEQGIVHRDLKPANIKVRSDGTVKVLDFGLAKAADSRGTLSADLATSPTLTGRATQIGVIVGTAGYMSPEQAKGKAADKRADIWAFGVVLYEMLTGRSPFIAGTIAETLAHVITRDVDLTALPAATPPRVRRLLARCLAKDPKQRLRDIGDARLELDDTEPAPALLAAPAHRSRAALIWSALAGTVAMVSVAMLIWQSSRPTSVSAVERLSIVPPAGTEFYPDSAQVRISPDGHRVAFVTGSTEQTQLWVRPVDSLVAHRIPEGDGAGLPFWSPDSQRIGFFANKKLKTVSASGGRAEVLADAPSGRGADWGRSNVLVAALDVTGVLYKLSANGGDPVPVTKLDTARHESAHRFPVFLPDGEHFLYAVLPGRAGKFDIFAGSIRDNSRTLVGSLESAPVYADPGWLLFAQRGVLVAQRFDPRTYQLRGRAIELPDEPTVILDSAASWKAGRTVSVSASGALAYFSGASRHTVPTWLDATGRPTGTLNMKPGPYSGVRISPDGTQAVLVRSESGSESSLWLIDLDRGSAAPLSSGKGRNDSPVWSPDGRRVVFSSDRDGPQNLFVKTVADAGPEAPFYRSSVVFKNPDSWSSDGKWVVIEQLDPVTAHDVFLLPASGEPTLKPYVQGRARDLAGLVSPTGQWLAYLSEDSGRFELYLQSFPHPGEKIEVSTKGAVAQWWTRNGRELMFTDGEQNLWQVDVPPGPTARLPPAKKIGVLPLNFVGIDMMPDGRRFLALVPERTGGGSITVVQNWQSALSSDGR